MLQRLSSQLEMDVSVSTNYLLCRYLAVYSSFPRFLKIWMPVVKGCAGFLVFLLYIRMIIGYVAGM